jgi:hypothetical protein
MALARTRLESPGERRVATRARGRRTGDRRRGNGRSRSASPRGSAAVTSRPTTSRRLKVTKSIRATAGFIGTNDL